VEIVGKLCHDLRPSVEQGLGWKNPMESAFPSNCQNTFHFENCGKDGRFRSWAGFPRKERYFAVIGCSFRSKEQNHPQRDYNEKIRSNIGTLSPTQMDAGGASESCTNPKPSRVSLSVRKNHGNILVETKNGPHLCKINTVKLCSGTSTITQVWETTTPSAKDKII
jgi:hypothetical protein